MKRILPELILKIDKGSFHITISPYTNRDTKQIESYTISLGSEKDKSVQLLVPTIANAKQEGTLISVQSEGKCFLSEEHTMTKQTQYLVNLGFSVAKDINPTCHRYILDDCSSFMCEIPNHKPQNVSMKPFHIAFHGKTWYEMYFGAKLVRGQKEYEQGIRNLYDSAKKPPTFNFVNQELQELLDPIYQSVTTWYDFFQSISKIFKQKKCAVVYPWLVSALIHVFDGSNIFEHPKWYIDLLENKLEEKTPFIPFHAYDVKRGGKRQTRKYKRQYLHTKIPPVYFIDSQLVRQAPYRIYSSM